MSIPFKSDIDMNNNKISNVTIEGTLKGNAETASEASYCSGLAEKAVKLSSARNISLTGAVSGRVAFNGSGDVVMTTTQANIAILTGSVSLTNDNDNNLNINYPEGFTNANCVVISCGLGREVNNYSFGQKKQNSGATLSGLPVNNVNLKPDTIKINTRFDFNISTTMTIYYKIVLLKTS